MTNFPNFVVRDSLLNPLTITLLSTDLEQIDEGTRYCIDAQIDDTDTLGRKGAILAESVQENGLKVRNSQSVSLNTSQSLSSLVSSNLQHIAECTCSFCALPPVDPNVVKNQPKQSAATVSAALNLSETFSLNSLAGANHTIYLDFNGHTTSGNSWNTSFNKANIVTPAFDFDGNTGSFSNAELERIQYIWQRVAEDFIPFNVNVTTQAPTDINDLIKSGTGDTRWGVRVAIGGSSYDWIGGWKLGSGDQHFVGDFDGNGKDDILIRSPQYAGLLTYNGSGFQSNSIQYDWIGGWKLGSGDQHFVGDFDGNGKDDILIRSPQYAGLLTYRVHLVSFPKSLPSMN